jgi:hypothetical protein
MCEVINLSYLRMIGKQVDNKSVSVNIIAVSVQQHTYYCHWWVGIWITFFLKAISSQNTLPIGVMLVQTSEK